MHDIDDSEIILVIMKMSGNNLFIYLFYKI